MQVLPIAALCMLVPACLAADFTVQRNWGAADMVDELELRGLVPAVSSQAPLTGREILQALPDTGRYRMYRRRLELMYPENRYRFTVETNLWDVLGDHRRRPSAESSSMLGLLGSNGTWSFVAFNAFQTGERVSSSSTGYSWRGMAANSDQIYVRWSPPGGHVQLGKDYLKTGAGLALSGRRPYEMIHGHYNLNPMLRLTSFTGQLDAYADSNGIGNRYLAGHRIELRTKQICIGVNEYVLYGGIGRVMSWYYLLPFYVYQGEQINRPFDDNVIWDADAKIIIPPVRFKAEVMIDDIQIERKSKTDQEPQEVGLLCQLSVAVVTAPVMISQHIEYTIITGWTYNQVKPWNRWLENGAPLGAEFGNDFDRLELATTFLGPCYRGLISLSFLRKGQGSITDDWTEPWINDPAWTSRFPAGIVEKKWTAVFSGQRDFLSRYRSLNILSSLSMRIGYESITNVGHQPGYHQIRLEAAGGIAVGFYF